MACAATDGGEPLYGRGLLGVVAAARAKGPGLLLDAVRAHELARLDPATSAEMREYLSRLLAAPATAWALGALALVLLPLALLCSCRRARRASAAPFGGRLAQTFAFALAAVVVALATPAGVRSTHGFWRAFDSFSCAGLELIADVSGFFGSLTIPVEMLRAAAEETLDGASETLAALASPLGALEALRARVTDLSATARRELEQLPDLVEGLANAAFPIVGELRASLAATEDALGAMRGPLAELEAVRARAIGVVDSRGWLREYAQLVLGALGEIVGSIDELHVNATAVMADTVLPVAARVEAGAATAFAVVLGVSLMCAIPLLAVLAFPAKRSSRLLLGAGCAGQWAQAVCGLAVGGVLLAATLVLLDVCAVSNAFVTDPASFLNNPRLRSPLIVPVAEACLLEPHRPVLDLLLEHFAPNGTAGNSLLSFLKTGSSGALLLEPQQLLGAVRAHAPQLASLVARARALEWRSLSPPLLKRPDLLRLCCELPEDERVCDDGRLRECAPARAMLYANATVLGALADVHAGADAVDAAVGELERALAEIADGLGAFGELVGPLLAALVRLREHGDCSFARSRYHELHEAACEASAPHLLWAAVGLLATGASGLAMSALLLRLVRRSLLAHAYEQLHLDDGDDDFVTTPATTVAVARGGASGVGEVATDAERPPTTTSSPLSARGARNEGRPAQDGHVMLANARPTTRYISQSGSGFARVAVAPAIVYV